MDQFTKLGVCQIVPCTEASLIICFGVYQMCEVEVLAEAHSEVGFAAQPCRSALQTDRTKARNGLRNGSQNGSIELGEDIKPGTEPEVIVAQYGHRHRIYAMVNWC